MAHTARKTQASPAPGAYDTLKEFEGKRYTGMKIGRSHHWQYDSGRWTEKKITPDEWEFTYAVTKRRRGKAPEGSGVPVGTQYHWYVLAHQTATKCDANSYAIDMAGMKFKLSHKRADKESWSSSDRAQRKRLIQILKDTVSELEKADSAQAKASKKKPAVAKKTAPTNRRATATKANAATASARKQPKRARKTAPASRRAHPSQRAAA
jgi:hypothetical protein